jgi:hypothetical protein
MAQLRERDELFSNEKLAQAVVIRHANALAYIIVRLFGRQFGAARILAQARAAELRGELAEAATLFAQGGRLDEASRVMLLRGDAETDLPSRLRHYVQAVATAPEGSSARTHARRRRATLILALATDEAGPTLAGERGLTPLLRQDLVEAARDLEALGEPERAAQAYARAGDVEGEARALARAGDVEKLDALLLAQQGRDREAIARRETHEQVALLVASGRRREALQLARGAIDDALRDRARGIEARRIAGEVVALTLRGRAMRVVLGDEVVVGRVGTLAVASAAVSRQHVAVGRGPGGVVVRDLGSRNGTLIRGLALAGEAAVGEGIELRLGKEVPLVVQPAAELPGAVTLEIGGARYVAPLGPARLDVGAWRLERGSDGWVELATDDAPPAFAGVMQLAARVTLLAGDGIAGERGGAPILTMGE